MATTFLGVDVSRYQGNINWSILSQNRSFAIIKATGGDVGLYTDSQFANYKAGAATYNMKRGFYHFFSNGSFDPAVEADYFCSVVAPLNNGDILFLDAEGSGVTVAGCKAFLDRVSSNFNGYKPGIYLNQGLVLEHDWSSVVSAGYFLWLADWTFSPNFGLGSGQWSSYFFHQYSDAGNVSGIPATTDLDAFDATTTGNLADWDTFGIGGGGGGGGGGGAPTPPPPTITTPTSQVSTSNFTQASPQVIIVPKYDYDKVVYSTEFSYTTFPGAIPHTINSDLPQASYPLGVYSIDNGATWQDLGMGIEASTFNFLGGSLIPDVLVSATVSPQGVISFSSIVNSGYQYEVLVKIALLATSASGTLTGSTLVQPTAFTSGSKLNNYSTYRRIFLDSTLTAAGTTGALTALPHNQATIPIPHLWQINSDGSITHQANQFDSRGEPADPLAAILLDNTNIYFGENSAANTIYGFRLYKDNA